MSYWTSVETLRKHMQAFDFDSIAVRFLPVVLPGVEDVQLPHNALVTGSISIRTMLALVPDGPEAVVMTGTSWHETGAEAFMPQSVAVGADDLPRLRYTEGIDYAVDHETGRIKRLTGGEITDGVTVQVWYLPLTTVVVDTDVEVDPAAGIIRRLASGSLADPSTVYVSYLTSPARASDEMLGEAVADAETKILARLKPGYDETSTDKPLIAGATELALGLVCDDLALGVLTHYGDASADDRSRRYMELARRYEERAMNSLGPFLRLPPPAVPVKKSASGETGW